MRLLTVAEADQRRGALSSESIRLQVRTFSTRATVPGNPSWYLDFYDQTLREVQKPRNELCYLTHHADTDERDWPRQCYRLFYGSYATFLSCFKTRGEKTLSYSVHRLSNANYTRITNDSPRKNWSATTMRILDMGSLFDLWGSVGHNGTDALGKGQEASDMHDERKALQMQRRDGNGVVWMIMLMRYRAGGISW